MDKYNIKGHVFKVTKVTGTNKSGLWVHFGRNSIWIEILDQNVKVHEDFQKYIKYIPKDVFDIFLSEIQRDFT